MVSAFTWLRYLSQKLEHAVAVSVKGYWEGTLTKKQVGDVLCKNFFQGKLTYTYWNRGEDMAPIVGHGGTLLVRKVVKIPKADSWGVLAGDIVILKDPTDSDNYLVRRLAAIEGDELTSVDYGEAPFDLEKGQCWLVADNVNLKMEEEPYYDSTTWGPVPMSNIVGRAIYYMRNAVDHGPVKNSELSVLKDTPVLEVELDVEEMAKDHKN